MTAGTLPAQPAEGHEPIPTHATGMPTPMVGMLLFIASEVMFFGGLFATYFNARASVGRTTGIRLRAPSWTFRSRRS